jgi:hypothetical protein
MRAPANPYPRRRASLIGVVALGLSGWSGALQAEPGSDEYPTGLGARLTKTHCGTCHALDQLARVRHTELGWALTIARMRSLNGARIPTEDAAQIRAHLAHAQPAETPQAWLEYGLVSLLTLLAPGWALWHWSRRGSRCRRRIEQDRAP